MSVVTIVLIVLSVIYLFGLIIFALRSRKPFKFLGLNALAGFFAVSLMSFVAPFLKITLFFNIYSLLVSLIWGIPGVIMILLTNMFF